MCFLKTMFSAHFSKITVSKLDFNCFWFHSLCWVWIQVYLNQIFESKIHLTSFLFSHKLFVKPSNWRTKPLSLKLVSMWLYSQVLVVIVKAKPLVYCVSELIPVFNLLHLPMVRWTPQSKQSVECSGKCRVIQCQCVEKKWVSVKCCW